MMPAVEQRFVGRRVCRAGPWRAPAPPRSAPRPPPSARCSMMSTWRSSRLVRLLELGRDRACSAANRASQVLSSWVCSATCWTRAIVGVGIDHIAALDQQLDDRSGNDRLHGMRRLAVGQQHALAGDARRHEAEHRPDQAGGDDDGEPTPPSCASPVESRTMRSVSWSDDTQAPQRLAPEHDARRIGRGWCLLGHGAPAGPIASPQPGAIYDGLSAHHGRSQGLLPCHLGMMRVPPRTNRGGSAGLWPLMAARERDPPRVFSRR